MIWARPNEHGIPGLRFDYRGPRGWLEIDQTTRPEPGYGFGNFPPRRQATLDCQCEAREAPNYGVWSVHLRRGALFLQIRSSGRDVAIRAARSLVPLG